MKCSVCGTPKAVLCDGCGKPFCRGHSSYFFDEDTRAFATLCIECAVKRREAWVRGKS